MNDDPILRSLAQVQREELDAEQASLDERWDRLSAGELSPEEEAELRALAETSEEGRQAYEAFRPLGPDFQAQVVRAVQAQNLAPEARRGGDPEPGKPSEQRRPLPRRASRWAGWSALAAAAALVLFLRSPAPAPPLVPLALDLEFWGGASAMRGKEPGEEIPVLAPGDTFQVILRPREEMPDAQEMEARCFLVRGQDRRPLEVQVKTARGGAIKINGSIGPEVPPGSWTLWVAAGRKGKLPKLLDPRTLAARARMVGPRDWTARFKDLQIQPRVRQP